MPKSIQEILDHADELAKRFEDYEPNPDDMTDPEPHNTIVRAVRVRADAEREIAEAVGRARAAGYTWNEIGGLLGTSAQAAHSRYGRDIAKAPRD